MKSFIKGIISYFNSRISHRKVFYFSIVFLLLSWVFSSFHYVNIYYGNNLSWINWVIAVTTLLYSSLPRDLSFKNFLKQVKKSEVLIVVFIIILYWLTHLWNFSTAPWNQNGLFDDAAWDIYFAKNYAFKTPFQAAFFDEVGLISREVVFHYYISILFKLFGYNLLVFNLSLLILGFVTVFFTTLIIHRLFKNNIVTLLSAIIINFFPLHYMHIFMGHRYAITAPLMVMSLYFLYTAFADKSFFRAAISSFFAALCWGSSIMGKQYILGLALSGLTLAVFAREKLKAKETWGTALVWLVGFIISASPLLAYIAFNYDAYVVREQGLLREFFSLFKNGGLFAIRPYLDQLAELFFAKHTFRRQFLPDFYIIPLFYYLLILPGLLIAITKKRFEIFFLSLIPIAGTLVSGSYDFRVLLAIPIWVISIAFCLHFMLNHKNNNFQAFRVISIVVVFLGLIPSIAYIWRVSKDPNYLHLLPHKDVAVSRLVQDIVVGSENPTSNMKNDEFNRKLDPGIISHDTLVCPYASYAIMHLYLQNYDDKKILSFCNQGIQLLKTSEEILNDNLDAIREYKPQAKDLKLVWEVSDKSKNIIVSFAKYQKFGSDETFMGVIDSKPFSLYVLTIKNENVNSFKKEISDSYPIRKY